MKQIEEAAIHAARRGHGYHKYVNDKTGSGSSQVLTDATLTLDIPEGWQLLITQMTFDMETVSDDCHFNIVGCSAVSGGGDPTELCGHVHIFTGTAVSSAASKERRFLPPLLVKYSTGYKSVTMRINTNDASCKVSCGYHCWMEKEL